MSNLTRLATMIVRSGAELDKLLETIDVSGFFGKCKPVSLKLFMEEYPNATISQNPRERESILRADGSVDPGDNLFGFWLPHGLNSQDEEVLPQSSVTVCSVSTRSNKCSGKSRVFPKKNCGWSPSRPSSSNGIPRSYQAPEMTIQISV